MVTTSGASPQIRRLYEYPHYVPDPMIPKASPTHNDGCHHGWTSLLLAGIRLKSSTAPTGWKNLEFSKSPFPKCDLDRKSTRLNSSHVAISYAVFCLKKKKKTPPIKPPNAASWSPYGTCW